MTLLNEGVLPRLSSLAASPTFIIACVIPIALFAFQKQSNGAPGAQNPRGCRKLGIHQTSNLADEHDERYGQRVEPGKDEDGMPSWRIKALAAYPIKSCKAVELESAHVVGTGFEYDRHFCLAEYITPTSVKPGATEAESAPRWVFRTLREGKYNRLTQVQPEIWVVDPESPTYSPDLEEVSWGGVLLVRYPKQKPDGLCGLMTSLGSIFGLYNPEGSFKVPLNVPEEENYPRREVRIFKDFPIAVDLGAHLPLSFKKFIGAQNPLTLFRADPKHYREIFRCAPRKEEVGFQPAVGFADTYPLHLLNLASVRDLGKRTASTIPKLTIRRFRPNIVIQGPGPYEEDAWKRIRINEHEIAAAARTTRCRLPNVDPDSGERHDSEPDKTMRSFRCIDEGDPRKACLGMQMVPSSQDFTLRVGDELVVLETGKHSWI
ncbi:hypothetical protein FQN54_003036 [Arachnomyces sp. PD_36]|nr:hypothetical protein FQN54_003036 [Arachnomyces sp. PD_36]